MKHTPRIFDCFPFFNEVELLELRLEQHYDHVDFFVLAEATHTFSGLPKPLHFEEHAERFDRFADKIIHVVIDDDIDTRNGWARENFQRDAIARGLKDARPDDTILLSDVDELLRGSTFAKLKTNPLHAGEVRCFELRWYQHYFNLRLPSMWIRNGPRAAMRRDVSNMSRLRSVKGPADKTISDLARQLMAAISMRRPVRRTVEKDAGWHFSWLGGEESVAAKLQAIPPQVGLNATHAADAISFIPTVDQVKQGVHDFSIERIDDSFPDFVVERRPFVAQYLLPVDT